MREKVLVLTKFYGNGQLSDFWRPYYEGTATAETDGHVKVKRYWFSKGEWLPKEGMFIKVHSLLPTTNKE